MVKPVQKLIVVDQRDGTVDRASGKLWCEAESTGRYCSRVGDSAINSVCHDIKQGEYLGTVQQKSILQ